MRYFIAKKHELEWKTEHLSDAEIYAAIRDLEPVRRRTNKLDSDTVFVICISLWILFLGSLGFIWLYP